MKMLSVSDVRNHLPSLIDEVAKGSDTLVITRYGKAIASIVPFKERKGRETRYPLRSRQIAVAKNFDEPLPDMWEALTVKERRDEYTARRNRGTRRAKGAGRK